MSKALYQEIASTVAARLNCLKSGNGEWLHRHENTLHRIAKEMLPSGSGIDSGTTINLDKSTAERLVLDSSWHGMSEHGYYTGWTDFQVIVTPSLAFGADIKVKGRMSADLREYIGEAYHACLTTIPDADHFRKALAG